MAALVSDQHEQAAVVRGHRGLDQRPHARIHLLLHLCFGIWALGIGV